MLNISTAEQQPTKPQAAKVIFLIGCREEFLQLAKIQSNAKVILDVGCGTGRLLRKAKNQWPSTRLIGVDAAEKMITQATRLFPEAEFHVAMAEALPLPDASIDLAFSTLSFHHWTNQAKGISEISRVLRSQIMFLLVDITIPRWLSFLLRVLDIIVQQKSAKCLCRQG